MADRKRKVVFSTDPEPQESARTDGAEAAPMNPAGPWAKQGNNPVRVHRDRKGRKGKTVSVVKGVLSPPAGKKALLKHLKGKLGTGGTVQGADIEIQGEQRARIVELLTALGFQAKVAGG